MTMQIKLSNKDALDLIRAIRVCEGDYASLLPGGPPPKHISEFIRRLGALAQRLKPIADQPAQARSKNPYRGMEDTEIDGYIFRE